MRQSNRVFQHSSCQPAALTHENQRLRATLGPRALKAGSSGRPWRSETMCCWLPVALILLSLQILG
eukprot:622152-Lingulodinium_polyedra.AAC.1